MFPPPVLLLPVVLLVTITPPTDGATDLTRVPGASGKAVVKATVALIKEACLFDNDFLFLKRLAYVTTTYGLDLDQGVGGGVWEISDEGLNRTRSNISTYTEIKATFNITWDDVTVEDLRKPLYSGLAAMMIAQSHAPLPKDLKSQAEFYENNFSGNSTVFEEKINSVGSESCETENLDMVFLLDSSTSINPADFEKSKAFTASVLGGFKVNVDAVRVAVSTFSTMFNEEFGFLDFNSTQDAQQAVRGTKKVHGGTNTAAAIDHLRESVFAEGKGSRKSAARIVIIQTDGQSDSKRKTIAAAEKLKDAGVIVFAIGLGNGIDAAELEGIASPPSCTHVRFLADFAELTSILTDIKETACKTLVVQGKNSANKYKSCGLTAVKVELDPDSDMSILAHPGLEEVDIFGSFQMSEPSVAFSDFSQQAKDGKPAILYVAGSDKPLYLSISGKMLEGGVCDQTTLIKVVPTNALKKTGASNLCIKNSIVGNCSEIDFIKSGNFVEMSASSPIIKRVCDNDNDKDDTNGYDGNADDDNKIDDDDDSDDDTPPATGYHPYPGSATKFIYCTSGPSGQAYVVTCPAGFAYLPSSQACIAPLSLAGTEPCKVCSKDNWDIGLRRFPVTVDNRSYVNCTGVLQCGVEACVRGSVYLPGGQACSTRVVYSTAHAVNSVVAMTIMGLGLVYTF